MKLFYMYMNNVKVFQVQSHKTSHVVASGYNLIFLVMLGSFLFQCGKFKCQGHGKRNLLPFPEYYFLVLLIFIHYSRRTQTFYSSICSSRLNIQYALFYDILSGVLVTFECSVCNGQFLIALSTA